MDNEELRNYIATQMGHNHLVQEIVKHQYYSRHMVILLKRCIENFIAGDLTERWVVIPGLRGVGKTTLVAQVYDWLYQSRVHNQSDNKINIIYISLDVVRNLGGNLAESLKIYESLLTKRFENLSQPVILFIDETQVDPNWAKLLKTIYDRTSNVFIICTGSAATYLQLDADVAGRRARIERLYPLSFIEYQMLAHKKLPAKGIKQQLLQICYHSNSAQKVYQQIHELQPILDQSWAKYDPNQVEDYLQIGTMPFALSRDRNRAHRALMNNIDKVITDDLISDRRFDFSQSSKIKMKQLLTLLASSNTMPSLNKLGEVLKVDLKNLSEMLEALIKAELLIRIPAYSSDFAVTRNPVKYQFMSPALRSAYWHITGNQQTAESRRGQLLEDASALHYYREFAARIDGSLTYPYIKNDPGYCDFILQIADSHQIALEFGLGHKTDRQVQQTMSNVSCKYGLVFANSPLKLCQDIVIVPLRYFFLM